MMTNWKRNIFLTAIPIGVITVGCLAAQDDMDSLIAEAQPRSADDEQRVNLRFVTLGDIDVAFDPEWDAYVGYEARKAAKSGYWEDIVRTRLFEDPLAIRFGMDSDGATDACTIEVAAGAEVLGEASVTVGLGLGESFGMLHRVESEDACDGDGFFFEETESGPFGLMSMCPSSCDSVLSAHKEGISVMLDVVIQG